MPSTLSGYAAVPGRRGERTIVAAEAEIVRQVFAEYVAGRTPRDIAIDLNRDKVRPPGGVIPVPGVELRIRLETGKLLIESVGFWPILNFEEGHPVAIAAKLSTEFYVGDGDHTRIALVLNSGPWQQRE